VDDSERNYGDPQEHGEHEEQSFRQIQPHNNGEIYLEVISKLIFKSILNQPGNVNFGNSHSPFSKGGRGDFISA
jgi:hypothetical protein